MLDQFFVAGTGMSVFQNMIVSVTNDVSNAQTVGYKRAVIDLENLFPKYLETAMADYDTETGKPVSKKKNIEIGSGVRLVGTRHDFSQGTAEVSNRPLDLMIQGQGFFQVQTPDGGLGYTRSGNFRQDAQGNIVTPDGYPLEPNIQIPQGATAILINSQGQVSVQINQEPTIQEIGQIQVIRFPNIDGIQSIGHNLYVATVASGTPIVETPGQNGIGTISQYTLEYSNVNVVDSMMEMVIIQRAFELVTKAVQAGESMLRDATDIARNA